MTTDDRTPMILTYIGKRRTTKGATRWAYVQEDGTPRVFAKRLYTCTVGGRIEIPATPDGVQVFPDGATYLGRVDKNDPRLIEWVAEDEYASQDEERARIARKANAEEPLEALLADLTKATLGLNRPQRRALAARIMEALYV